MPGKGAKKRREQGLGSGKRQRLKRQLFEAHPFCHYCGTEVRFVEARLEHRIPLSRGGTNDVDNLVLACAPCDIAKDDAIWWTA